MLVWFLNETGDIHGDIVWQTQDVGSNIHVMPAYMVQDLKHNARGAAY
jgi:hypothetical protein